MKRIVFLAFCLLASLCSIAQSASSKEILYIGTFADRGSKGIYVLNFDRTNGKISELQTVGDGEGPSFLAIHPNKKFLYAIYGKGIGAKSQTGSVIAYQINPATGKLTKLGREQPSEGSDPCHVSIDPKGRFIYVSNYGTGSLSVYPIQKDGSVGKVADVIQHQGKSVNPARQQGPHMHSVIPSPDGKWIYATDLGLDKIMIYAVNPATGKLTPASKPFAASVPGAGPRHLAIHPNGNFACSAEELSSKVAVYKVDKKTGGLTPVEQITMLPENFTEKSYAADIHFSPDGKFLYASNRGHNSLAIYKVDPQTGKLTVVGHEATHGGHPRNFCVDAKGEWVFVTNRDNDNVVVFKRDKATGKLTYTGWEAKIPMAVCVQQLFLK